MGGKLWRWRMTRRQLEGGKEGGRKGKKWKEREAEKEVQRGERMKGNTMEEKMTKGKKGEKG